MSVTGLQFAFASTYAGLSAIKRDRRTLLSLLAVIVYYSLYLLYLIFRWGGDEYLDVINDTALLPLGLAATWFPWRAAKSAALDNRTRRAWRNIGGAWLAYTIGNAIYLYYEVILRRSPFPSWADVGYICFYPLMLVGLLSFSTPLRTRAERLRFGLDAGMIVLGGGMLLWYFLLLPIALAPHVGFLDSLLSLGYPVLSMVLLFGIASVLLRRPSKNNRCALGFLLVGIAVYAVADLIYGYQSLAGTYHSGTWADGLYSAAHFVVIVAAIYQSWTAHTQTSRPFNDTAINTAATAAVVKATDIEPEQYAGKGLNLLPYGAVVIGYALLIYVARDQWITPLGKLLFGALALTGLVVARQVIAVRDNIKLLAEHAARSSESRFHSLVQHSSDVIVVVNRDLIVSYISSSVERMFGVPAEKIIGREFFRSVYVDNARAWRAHVEEAIRRKGVTPPTEWRLRHISGSWVEVEATGNNLLHEENIGGLVINVRDITDRKRAEEKLVHDAFHDSLTELPNRAMFNNLLQRALRRAKINSVSNLNNSFAVLFIDLDRFKIINDSLGHLVGDKLLSEIARRLETCLRLGDTVARLGGDEFTILAQNVNHISEVTKLAERIQHAISLPYNLAGHEVSTTASIGIAACACGDSAHYTTPEEVLRDADTAMYQAKLKGKARHQLFDESMHAQAVNQMALEHDLRRAIEREELFLLYQPIVNLASGKLEGFEALVRWRHPQRGLVMPNDFIALAEETNLIVPLGEWVWRAACEQMKQWQVEFPELTDSLSVAVNLSGKQFRRSDLAARVRQVLQETQLAAHHLKLEITESAVMENMKAAAEVMHELRAAGIRFSMDDFGTGYSSLSYLHRFPLDTLKIDRSFVMRLDDASENTEIVRTILTLAHTLGMNVVAEGVETDSQMRQLQMLGCQYAQGYLFAKPLAADTAHGLIASQHVYQNCALMTSSPPPTTLPPLTTDPTQQVDAWSASVA